MFIIYNQDGSVKETNFTEFINKGSNNANSIYVRVNGWNATAYGAYAVFKLPNDQATVIIGELVEDYEETIYTDENGNPVKRAFLGYGYLITLTQDVTCFAGIVKCTIKVTDGDEENPEILYTYPVDLTINDTAIAPEDLTLANLSQYNNLKRYLDGQVTSIKTWANNRFSRTKIYQHYITKGLGGYAWYIFTLNKTPITTPSALYDVLRAASSDFWLGKAIYTGYGKIIGAASGSSSISLYIITENYYVNNGELSISHANIPIYATDTLSDTVTEITN